MADIDWLKLAKEMGREVIHTPVNRAEYGRIVKRAEREKGRALARERWMEERIGRVIEFNFWKLIESDEEVLNLALAGDVEWLEGIVRLLEKKKLINVSQNFYTERMVKI